MMSSGLRGLHHSFEHRQHGLQVRKLLLVEKDVDVVQFGDHLVGVGHEVGRQVAAVELHAFDDFEFGFSGLGFLDGDDAFVADLLHGFGNHLADFLSPLAEIVPTCSTSDEVLIFLAFFDQVLA
jgi:hypothetical protein